MIPSVKRSLNLQLETDFYRKFFKIAVPVTLQALMAASLNLIDNIMVGQLGDVSIAGVGLANQYCFIFQVILFGICGGGSIFISQFWGNRNIPGIRKVLGISLIVAVAGALLFCLGGFLFPRQVLTVFSGKPDVIASGSSFLRIISITFLLNAVSMCYANASRATGTVLLPMTTSIIAVVTNTSLNFILIFGRFGLPRLGVAGAATSTLIARSLEVVILLTVIYTKKKVAAARFHELFDFSKDFVKKFFATAGAVTAKDAIWAVGTASYMAIYARIGTEAVASINIVSTIKQLCYVLFTGIANACLIMVGNLIGVNDKSTAYRYAKRFLKITFVLGIGVGAVVMLARPLILAPYKVTDGVVNGALGILFILSFELCLEVFNMVAICGVIRSGGDVNFCIVLDTIAVWVIGLPLGILGGIVLKLPVNWVFAMIVSQEIFKFVLSLRRVASRKWINNLVHDIR